MHEALPTLHPRFRLARRLGAGGFGTVYAAFDEERREQVAIKRLHRLSGSARERFKREFRELSQLTHPNLPLLYELFHRDDEWFFSMELIEGVSLGAYLAGDDVPATLEPSATRTAPFDAEGAPVLDRAMPNLVPDAPTKAAPRDERRLRHALAQLLDVVGFIHQRGYVHGDLKPANVLVAPNERLYLLDFGLVSRLDEVRTERAGTMAYAAPELRSGGPVERASDVYALGTMFFALCADRLPFTGEGENLLLEKARHPAPPVRSLAPWVPEDVAHLIDGWLVADPRFRPALPGATSAPGRFVGRVAELTQLDDALARVSTSGRTEVMLLEGKSGFGKTALLQAFVGRAPALVLAGRASAREHVPFNAFDGVLDRLSPLPPCSRSELPLVIKQRVQALAGDRPIVLWLDDMHWADADSVAVLEELVQPPRLRACLLLLSARPHETGYAELRLPCPVQRLALGPLVDGDARALARSLGLTDDQVPAVVQRARGDALFLEALCAAEEREYGDAATLIKSEVARLPPLDRSLLDVLALSQTPLPATQLAQLFAMPPNDPLGRVLERLCRRRLVRLVSLPDHVAYAPHHDQVREAALELMSIAERRAHHERLLGVLVEDEPRLLAARFEHLRGAGRTAEAALLARKAAATAEAAAAYEQAAGHLEQALALGTSTPEERAACLAQLVDDLERAKLGPRAAEVALELARIAPDGKQRSAAMIRAVRHFFAAGDVDRGRALLTQALAERGERWPTSDLEAVVRILAERHFPRRPRASHDELASQYELVSGVADGLMLIDPSRSILFVARAISRAALLAREDWRSLQLLRETLYVGSLGAIGRLSVRIYSLPTARRITAYTPAHHAWEQLALANMELHRNPRAATSAKLASASAEFAALPDTDGIWLGNIGLIQGTCMRVIGDLPGLRTQAAWLAKLAERRRDSALRTTTLLGGHLVWLADDAPEVSRHVLRTVPWPRRHDAFHFQHWLRAEAEVETSLYEGDGEGGWARIAEVRGALVASAIKALQTVRMSCNFTVGRALLGLLEARAARGQRVRHRDRLAIHGLAAWLDLEGSDAARVRAALLRAGLAAVLEDPRDTRRHLRKVYALATAAGYSLYVALAQLGLGALGDPTLRRAGEAGLHALGVVRPERFLAVELPGLRRYFVGAADATPPTTRSVPSSVSR